MWTSEEKVLGFLVILLMVFLFARGDREWRYATCSDVRLHVCMYVRLERNINIYRNDFARNTSIEQAEV